jgi:hypothetical protein
VFGCEYSNGLPDKKPGDPVTNPTLEQDIQDEISREIQTLGYILQPFRIYEQSRDVVGIAIDDPRKTDPPFVFQQPKRRNAPTSPRQGLGKQYGQHASDARFLQHFLTTYIVLCCSIYTCIFQDWHSAVGVILWVVVAVVFTTITHLAGIRHRERFKMDLSTPDGVEALLDVQWRHQQDDTIQIYHRNARQRRCLRYVNSKNNKNF